MPKTSLLLSLIPFGVLSFAACVGDSPIGGTDSSTTDSPSGSDSSVVDSPAESSADAADAAPPPCGEAGEDCCKSPLAPCDDGLACSTSSPSKCMVSDAWAFGTYGVVTQGNTFPSNAFVSAHYDGSTWTLGTIVRTFAPDLNSYDIEDAYQNGAQVRVLTYEVSVGHEYWWTGAAWNECTPGNNCDGPTQTSAAWALSSTQNNGSTDYWLGGSGVIYRCPSTALCAKATGVPGSIGEGHFAGQTSQDLWYASIDHVYHFDGSNWTSTPVDDALGMYDVGPKDIWAGYTKLRHWDGTAWSNAYLIDGAKTPGGIYSIAGSATDDVFAAGYNAGNGSASFVGHWNGQTWKMTTLPTGMTSTQEIYAPSRIEAFVVGANAVGDNKGIFAHWNGTTWSTMPAPTVSIPQEKSPGTVTWTHVTGRARPRRAP